jgi:hypothetical protein
MRPRPRLAVALTAAIVCRVSPPRSSSASAASLLLVIGSRYRARVVTQHELQQLIGETFPARATNELASLDLVSVEDHADPGAFFVTLRLILWELSTPETLSIIDVKEQQVYFKPPPGAAGSAERIAAFVRALVRVLATVLESPQLPTLMPHDLFVWSPLKLAKPQTDDDFAAALRVKSRLGRYLPAT